VNSTWKPDQPPYKITQQLGNFEGAISSHFRPQCGKISQNSKQVFYNRSGVNPNIIIAHADKNLGPGGVNTEQYIC
jgi:hypothetical protein